MSHGDIGRKSWGECKGPEAIFPLLIERPQEVSVWKGGSTEESSGG